MTIGILENNNNNDDNNSNNNNNNSQCFKGRSILSEGHMDNVKDFFFFPTNSYMVKL